MTSNIELVKIKEKPMKGRAFDEFRCFYIKDFRRGDCIRVKMTRRSEPIKGVVTDVDLENNVIHFKTSETETSKVTIDKITTLEGHVKNWLE